MKLVYFAWMKEKAGIGEETVNPPATVTDLGQLVEWLKERGEPYTSMFQNMAAIRAAINYEYVKIDAAVGPDDEVAFFPPVTGG
ncbi:MAG: molybdopterin converting factor subunit 1 [Rhodospirillales bacterium]|nr:molybdopterin converting factor subunit 1 [Rhodospirillales bacterium]